MWLKFYIVFVIFLLIWYSFFSYQNFKNIKVNTQILVKKWDNISSIKNNLCKKNILSNCLFADLYFYFNWPNKIIPWNYNFSWENLSWVFAQLEKWPPIKYAKFTILPWQTKFDIASKLKNLSEDSQKNFLALISNKKFIENLQNQYPELKKFWNIKSLEWFLYPDTYFFKPSDLKSYLFPQLLIKTAIKNFTNKTKNLNWNNPYNLSPYKILIIASIVQKEEFNPKNKPLVADILIRRYLHHWKIWADWTLCYGLKVTSNECKNYLYNKYLQDKSNPYNTRANLGLPPTPVSNPTISTIKATLNPQKNSYWYYLHDKNWNIHFAKTANEHNLNKYKFLK